MNEHRSVVRMREQGMASFLALALMLVLTVLGLSCLLFAGNSRQMTAEYQREVQLDLAAAGALERVAQEACRDPAALQRNNPAHLYEEERLTAFGPLILRVAGRQAAGYIELTAVAHEQHDARWQRHRAVRGILVEKEGGYVWLGRIP